jgi:hypothetical protein
MKVVTSSWAERRPLEEAVIVAVPSRALVVRDAIADV